VPPPAARTFLALLAIPLLLTLPGCERPEAAPLIMILEEELPPPFRSAAEAESALRRLNHYGYRAGYGGVETTFSKLYRWHANFGSRDRAVGFLSSPNPAVRMLGIDLLTAQGRKPAGPEV